MLKRIRQCLAVVMILAITLLFVDISGVLHTYLAWTAQIQFLPALLALNIGVVAVMIVITLIFGRIYCSVICPLGITQDFFAWLGKKRKKNRYSFSQEKKILRYSVFGVFAVCLIVGVPLVTTILEPYSAFGRIVGGLFQPLVLLINNGLASVAEHYNSYIFYSREVWLRGLSPIILGTITLVVIGILGWRNGRTYCNTICPVGTLLSFFARFSVYRVKIDENKCVGCRLCEKNCKAAAIDIATHTIDYSRCVDCFDCIDKCNKDALHYELAYGSLKAQSEQSQPDESRRAFVVGTALLAATAVSAQAHKKVDGGLAVIEDKKEPTRKTPIMPVGAVSQKQFAQRCTACQLCVTKCPTNVLRPSNDINHFMQPYMSFENGYCRPECTACADVCPTDAIRPFKRENKVDIHVGHAVWIEQNCIPVVDGVECTQCARKCPVGAIQLVEHFTGSAFVNVPVVDESLCIGCGACENMCPARPFSAIYVEGYEQQIIE